MQIFRSKEEIANYSENQRDKGLKIAFVPTMGALHEGHLSLIDEANKIADISIASIFVNPKQFAPGEDFEKYPRTEENDLNLLKMHGCDAVFIPEVDVVYPKNEVKELRVDKFADILCGMTRPHFFHGVITVVLRLFDIVKPNNAIFGEKDWQQLQIIKDAVNKHNLKINIIGAPIVREDDGLAMSSRNKYLKEEERAFASKIFDNMKLIRQEVKNGENIHKVLESAKINFLEKGFDLVDYIEIRNENKFTLYGAVSTIEERKEYYKKNIMNLGSTDQGNVSEMDGLRVFVAAIIGKTRLIDNLGF